MKAYQYDEHGLSYQLGKCLRPWRPEFPIIARWVKRGSRVLDAGCGDGVLGEKLIKEKRCTVFGFDLDRIGVQEARRRGIEAIVHDADNKFPYKDKQFDVVVSNGLSPFVVKPNSVVSELKRVGKTAIVSFPNFGFWFYRLEMLLGKFPSFALYGHTWWTTRQIKFFSFADFLSLPAMKDTTIKKLVCLDWRNRVPSTLAELSPNLFGRSCIIEF